MQRKQEHFFAQPGNERDAQKAGRALSQPYQGEENKSNQ